MLDIAILFCLVIIIILLIVVLICQRAGAKNIPDDVKSSIQSTIQTSSQNMLQSDAKLSGQIESLMNGMRHINANINEVRTGIIKEVNEGFINIKDQNTEANEHMFAKLHEGLTSVMQESRDAQTHASQNLQHGLDQIQTSTEKQLAKIQEDVKEIAIQNEKTNNSVIDRLENGLNAMTKDNHQAQDTLTNNLRQGLDQVQNSTKEMLTQNQQANEHVLEQLHQGLTSVSQENRQTQTQIMDNLQQGLVQIQESTERHLSLVQEDVNKKLDISLNQRLDDSFAKVTSQLTELYKSLGELSHMSDGIQSLNRTLANVKARGTWGEVQLDTILTETMPEGQYLRNVKLAENTDDFVEFAIKIPSKDNSEEFILLPIDSKFPMDRYNEIVEASEAGDAVAIQNAIRNLSARIKDEAKKIRDKYVCPPTTTDFAIMFLPTESLYAEVLRIDGLAEYCQNEYRVVISGPTTITALLNSLRIGFANLSLNEKTNEVRHLLQAVKTQYGKLDELIDTTQKRLQMAVKSTDELKGRTNIIRKRMAKIDALDTLQEADDVLRIGDDIIVADDQLPTTD